MRPIVALFSECHELFGHDDHGAVAAELATKTIKRARKTGITLLFDTQSSRKEAIPPKLVELVSVNACFYVKTWRSNDGFLGDGSFAAGIRATELRPGRDRGTSVITGVSDAQFELLRWFFVEVDDDTGYDAAADVIARAVANVAPGTAVEGSAPVAAIESRDLLDDLDQVVGDDRVKLADLPARLRKLAPGWGPYRAMTGAELRGILDDEGVKTGRTGNVWRARPGRRPARAGRARREVGRHHGGTFAPHAMIGRTLPVTCKEVRKVRDPEEVHRPFPMAPGASSGSHRRCTYLPPGWYPVASEPTWAVACRAADQPVCYEWSSLLKLRHRLICW